MSQKSRNEINEECDRLDRQCSLRVCLAASIQFLQIILFWWRELKTMISLFAVNRRKCSVFDSLQKSQRVRFKQQQLTWLDSWTSSKDAEKTWSIWNVNWIRDIKNWKTASACVARCETNEWRLSDDDQKSTIETVEEKQTTGNEHNSEAHIILVSLRSEFFEFSTSNFNHSFFICFWDTMFLIDLNFVQFYKDFVKVDLIDKRSLMTLFNDIFVIRRKEYTSTTFKFSSE